MNPTGLLLRTRLKIINNYVAGIHRHLLIHLFVFLGIVGILVLGGTAFFQFLFGYLERQEEFGQLLMNRLVAMVMLVFLSMLIFSNLIITLSTTYISSEIEYLMGQPIPHRSIFFMKLMESAVYSSWAFAILSLPLFISFGKVREVDFWFYPMMIVIVIPFLAIPAALGSLITMLLSAYLPARRALKWTILGVAVTAIGGFVAVRFSGIRSALFSGGVENFTQILNMLKMGQTLWSPHYWIARTMVAMARGDWKEYFYWLAMMVSTALMLIQVCVWLAPRLYYRGWGLATDTGGARSGRSTLGGIIFDGIERGMRSLRPATRALVIKDMKTFWRDPAQWSQLIILFGLLFLYMANLRSAHAQSLNFRGLLPFWQTVISFFNMGATCFILSILTTRFVYPLLSLEGKQYWVVGLAPISRDRIVWQKYWLCWIASLGVAQTLMIFSNWILRVNQPMMILSTATIFFLSFGLTSLSVGLGATTPNFREDNPARIANGLGGTLNVILSLIYIGLVISIEVYLAFLWISGRLELNRQKLKLLTVSLGALILIHCTAIIVPMLIGLKRWRRMEF